MVSWPRLAVNLFLAVKKDGINSSLVRGMCAHCWNETTH